MKYPKETKRKTNNDVQNTKQKRQTMIYKIQNRKDIRIDLLIDWLLLSVQREVFQLYSGREQVQ